MSAPLRLGDNVRLVQGDHPHVYSIIVEGEEVGVVYRTGTLPSCQRWWAAEIVKREEDPSPFGLDLRSRATRKEAVESFLAAYAQSRRTP